MPTPYIDVPFGPFMPDLNGAPNQQARGYLVAANNVYLDVAGYRGLPTFESVSGLSATPVEVDIGSAFLVNHPLVSSDIFVAGRGGLDGLYQADGTAWSAWQDVTPAGGWSGGQSTHFALFDDLVIATNGADNPAQKSLSDTTATAFADLGGSPPVSYFVARIRDHLVLGPTPGDRHTIRWSAIGDPEDWPTPNTADALAKQSGEQTLPREYGMVVAIVGGEKVGLIIQQSAITRMTYVGGNVQFEFDTFAKSVGGGRFAFGTHTFVAEGWTYFYAHYNRGIYRTDGYVVEDVTGPIKEALFIDSLDHDLGGGLNIESVGADLKRGLIAFLASNIYTSASSSVALFYNYKSNTWTTSTGSDYGTSQPNLFSGLGGDGNTSTALWNITEAGQPQINSGAPGSITMQTGFIAVDPGFYVELEGLHLLGNNVPGNLTVSYKAADDFGDISLSSSGFTAMTAPPRGLKYTARARAPYFAFRITGTASAAQLLQGIRIYFKRSEPVQ